jgi:hypothetical protein
VTWLPSQGIYFFRLPESSLIPHQTARRQPRQNNTQENLTRQVDTSSLGKTATFPEVQRKLCLHRPLGIPQSPPQPENEGRGGIVLEQTPQLCKTLAREAMLRYRNEFGGHGVIIMLATYSTDLPSALYKPNYA